MARSVLSIPLFLYLSFFASANVLPRVAGGTSTTGAAVVTSPDTLGSCPSIDGTEYVTANGTYLIQCSTDYSGQNTGGLNGNVVASFQACLDQCSANPTCVTISYRWKQQKCWTHKAVTAYTSTALALSAKLILGPGGAPLPGSTVTSQASTSASTTSSSSGSSSSSLITTSSTSSSPSSSPSTSSEESSCALAAQSSDNIIIDYGFETSQSGVWVANGASLDSTVSNSGQSSVRLANGAFIYNSPPSFPASTTVYVSFAAKYDPSTASACSLYILAGEKTYQNIDFTSAFDWTCFTSSFVSTEDGETDPGFGFDCSGDANVWLDDIYFGLAPPTFSSTTDSSSSSSSAAASSTSSSSSGSSSSSSAAASSTISSPASSSSAAAASTSSSSSSAAASSTTSSSSSAAASSTYSLAASSVSSSSSSAAASSTISSSSSAAASITSVSSSPSSAAASSSVATSSTTSSSSAAASSSVAASSTSSSSASSTSASASSSSTPIPGINCPSDNGQNYTDAQGLVYTIQCDTYLDGYSLQNSESSLNVNSFSECISACFNTWEHECIAVVYYPYDVEDNCEFKTSQATLPSFSSDSDLGWPAHSAILVSAPDCSTLSCSDNDYQYCLSSGELFQISCNVVYEANSIEGFGVNVETLAECIDMCAGLKGCLGVDFFEDQYRENGSLAMPSTNCYPLITPQNSVNGDDAEGGWSALSLAAVNQGWGYYVDTIQQEDSRKLKRGVRSPSDYGSGEM